MPAALWLARYRPPARSVPVQAAYRQVAAGFAMIATRRPLLRATVTSVVSYVGIGMLLVCCPVLGAHRLGGADRGALLISAMAAASLIANARLARRGWRRAPDFGVLASTLVIGASMAATAIAPGWFTMLAAAAGGAGEGPQLTAVFAVRHRETPDHMRGQVYTTAASLKIAGLAAGAALAGPLAGRSVTACLLIGAGIELCAAAAYLVTGPPGRGARGPAEGAGAGAASGGWTGIPRLVRHKYPWYHQAHAADSASAVVVGRLGTVATSIDDRPSGMDGLLRAQGRPPGPGKDG